MYVRAKARTLQLKLVPFKLIRDQKMPK